jgi:TRAP-type C4-dicarboxylate transport system substrate-binding protein
MKQFKPPPQEKPTWMSEEAWQEQVEEMRAFAKRVYKQSGGQLDVDPFRDSQPKSIH